jgi:hypothetical protein
MAVSWRRLTLVGLGAIYLASAAFLAGVVTERVRFDRERMATVRSREQRTREARAQAIRIELEHEAARLPREH